MLRAQALWNGGSLTAIYSPKLADKPSDGAFNPDWGATNSRARWLMAYSQKLSDGLSPQWLLSGGAGQSPVLAESATFYTTVGLLANTTAAFFVRASACGGTADSDVFALATKPLATAPAAPAFVGVAADQLRVQWTRLPAAPQEQSSEGYRLEASTDSNFNGTIFASTTYSAAQSTLSVTSLSPNTTYHLRVAALNWAGALSSFTALGSTSTLANAVAQANAAGVARGSMTVNWTPLPSAPPSATAEGYRLMLSSTNFGALSPGGVVYSSSTPNVALSTLTISGLSTATIYYIRVGSLNWAGAVNDVSASPAATLRRRVRVLTISP